MTGGDPMKLKHEMVMDRGDAPVVIPVEVQLSFKPPTRISVFTTVQPRLASLFLA